MFWNVNDYLKNINMKLISNKEIKREKIILKRFREAAQAMNVWVQIVLLL